MPVLIVRNARVIDPSQGLNTLCQVVVKDGVITDLPKELPADFFADATIDAKGLVLAPGFIDLHTHLREPGEETLETIESGTMAAAAGGFTTILAMANTNPVCDSETGVQYVLSRTAASGVVKVMPVAAVTKGRKGEEMSNMGKLQAAGAIAFSDSFHSVMNAEIMRRTLEYTAMLGVPILEHCEDSNLTGEGLMHEGAISLKLGLKGIPRVAESIMVARNVALAAHTGGHIHICHVSTREAVEAIREGKRNGVRVTAEVTPHHLTMTDQDVLGYNTLAKVRPPLCTEDDRRALQEGLEDGTIDCIATDHAPHSGSAKGSTFDAAPFGIIGMESAFPLLYTRFVAGGNWTLDFLIEKLTIGPASVLRKEWGTIAKGQSADFVLLQLDAPYRFTREDLRSKCSNCPWLGMEMKARVAATFVNGVQVHRSEAVFAPTAVNVKGIAAVEGDAISGSAKLAPRKFAPPVELIATTSKTGKSAKSKAAKGTKTVKSSDSAKSAKKKKKK